MKTKKQNFLYGTVIKLTREDTLSDIERNFTKMREAGLDTAVVWPSAFWWEEKSELYPFKTGIEVLRIAEKAGVKVIMELAGQLPMMEYIPDFRMKDEYYCVDENGNKRVGFSSFGPLNYFHPEVRELICRHYEETARAYRDCPSLIAYDVFNETAFNSFDRYTMEAFRSWLVEKYGTIERLNEVWEHCYTDFSQVSFSPWMWMSVMPAADFGAFRRESVAIFMKDWCEAIRAVDDTRPLIVDNIGSMITAGAGVYERPQDDYVLRDAADEIGMSFYPKQVTGTQSPSSRWNTFDAFYSASARKGFYVSEMQTHIQALFNPTTAVRPYELKQWCIEALSAGAKGLIWWMWRPFTKGLQTAGRGLVDYKERPTPRLEFASEYSRLVEKTGVLTPERSKAAILFDPLCLDLQLLYTKCYKVDQNIYLDSLRGAYDAFLAAGARPDIVAVRDIDEISEYKALILTNHIVIGKELAKKLSDFVRGGGVVICDGKVGVVDELGTLNPTLPGGDFNELMGYEYIDSDYEGLGFSFGGDRYNGYYGREIVETKDCDVLGSFEGGSPAVTVKRSGKGEVICFNTYPWYGFTESGDTAYTDIAAALTARYGLSSVSATAPLKVRAASSEEGYFLFVFNYTDDTVSGRVSWEGFDLPVTVKPRDVMVIRRDNDGRFENIENIENIEKI